MKRTQVEDRLLSETLVHLIWERFLKAPRFGEWWDTLSIAERTKVLDAASRETRFFFKVNGMAKKTHKRTVKKAHTIARSIMRSGSRVRNPWAVGMRTAKRAAAKRRRKRR